MNEDRYVISASEIVEIIPCVTLKKVPMLPDYAAGILNYHGQQMPVVDLCELLLTRPCKKRLSTRIIVVNKSTVTMKMMKVGFMVERATEVIVIDDKNFKIPAMKNPDVPTNGKIAEHEGFLVTQISVDDVFEKLDDKFFNDQEFSSIEK